MSPVEVEAFLSAAEVGVLSTLRADGSPIALPMWFVLVDGEVCFRSRRNTRKVARIERDSRVSFLVESGAAWAELAAVLVSGRAELAEGELGARIETAMEQKYANLGVPEVVPARTREHYAVPTLHYRIRPEGLPLTWDNAKLLQGPPPVEPLG